MKQKNVKRSPLFYVGDKYKLITEIKSHFPTSIRHFVEPFVGGGSVFLNVSAQDFILNDLNVDLINLHRFLCAQKDNTSEFFTRMFALIDSYGLSCSYRRDEIPIELKSEYKKTYFAKFNKSNFQRLKSDFNSQHRDNMLYLYVLLIYGFNRMIRFNGKNEYNLPVGNVDFNQNVYDALCTYFEEVGQKKISWNCQDFSAMLEDLNLDESDFVYCDPPYLITFSEYNKLWNVDTEQRLLRLLDVLNRRGIRFAISNVTHYKGRENSIFIEWANHYNIHPIKSNYISYHDNTIKAFNEVLVTNY